MLKRHAQRRVHRLIQIRPAQLSQLFKPRIRLAARLDHVRQIDDLFELRHVRMPRCVPADCAQHLRIRYAVNSFCKVHARDRMHQRLGFLHHRVELFSLGGFHHLRNRQAFCAVMQQPGERRLFLVLSETTRHLPCGCFHAKGMGKALFIECLFQLIYHFFAFHPFSSIRFQIKIMRMDIVFNGLRHQPRKALSCPDPLTNERRRNIHLSRIQKSDIRAALRPKTCQRNDILRRLSFAHHHKKPTAFNHLVNLTPRSQGAKRIRPNEVNQLAIRHLCMQIRQCIDRIDYAAAVDFLSGNRHALLVFDSKLDHAQTVVFIRKPIMLMRRVARRQKKHAVHSSAFNRRSCQIHMPTVNRIKAAAHQTDSRHRSFLLHHAKQHMIHYYIKFPPLRKEETAYNLKKARNLRPSFSFIRRFSA